jgi:hypothetical protein
MAKRITDLEDAARLLAWRRDGVGIFFSAPSTPSAKWELFLDGTMVGEGLTFEKMILAGANHFVNDYYVEIDRELQEAFGNE